MNWFYERLYLWSKKKRRHLPSKDKMALKANGFKVSQHALIRYFERVENYNITNVVNGLTRSLKLKDGEQTVGGVKVFVIGHTVVTVLPNREDSGNRIRGLENLRPQKEEVV